ncbi:MAG: AAA family ATPase [Candidatus Scalindua sp.]|nr:AAA family ATPase [Candidatus Scalindua sp.]
MKALKPESLYHSCDPDQFTFETTNDLEDLHEIIGQPRAVEAVQFGLGIDREGYNIFAFGPAGIGKHTFVQQFLKKEAASRSTPPDWCYVCNFEDPQKPRALSLPPGRGIQLKKDIEHLLEELQTVIPTAFQSEEYRTRRQDIEDEFKEKEQQIIEKLQRRAKEKGLNVFRTPVGVAFAPSRNGKVLTPEEFQKLPEEERLRIEKEVDALQKESQDIFQQLPRWENEIRNKLRELSREIARFVVSNLINELKKTYEDLAEVLHYLEALQEDIIDNIKDFLKNEPFQRSPEGTAGQLSNEAPSLSVYMINLLVDHSNSSGASVVYEDHPTYQNLIGRVEYLSEMGTLLTDFSMIKAGALHRANGGYLILDAQKILTQPYAWEGLKRVLRSRQIRIESLGQMFSLISTVSLEPEPIPLTIKVVLVGSPMLYYLLCRYDPEFNKLFKVAADFDDQMSRNQEHQQLYARLIGTLVRKEALCPFDRTAVARVIEQSSRLKGDNEKLTTRFQSIADLLRESDYYTKQSNKAVVTAVEVQKAIDTRLYRSGRLRERLHEEIVRNTILIDTGGEMIGQVNGISVIQLGDFAFGSPSRITARVRVGKGEVINIEREVKLSGPIHSKGVLILSGFLGGRYAKEHPFSLTVSLVFEQSYGGVEGDSASSAELYVILSAIADIPLKQSLAVTGSVNQHGQIQAIGRVNEKIEGFFDICRAKGLNGEQGVLIPGSNVKHLMLRRDVVDAVTEGLFHIYPVETIDQGIEILTGIPAGTPDTSGKYPEGTVNGLVKTELEELAEKRSVFLASEEEKKNR